MDNLYGTKIGFALSGSFCTFEKAFIQMKKLVDAGAIVTPIMSYNAYTTDSRFGTAEENNNKIEEICQKEIIHTIVGVEPIGPKKMFDVLVVAPCTGNTLAKLALGITDTPVTMAVKSHVRNARPVVINISTNDALSGSAKNIGMLCNYRNYYFVPMHQDNPIDKPASVVADFERLPETILLALAGIQLQPMIF